MNDSIEFRKVKALEDIVDYMRRIDALLTVMSATFERIEQNVGV